MIHIITGNTGAGKTSYSLHLKRETKSMLFSIDKWNNALFFPDKKDSDGVEWILERIARAENMMMSQMVQLEELGIDSILDLGFSKFEHREKFRIFAKKNDFEFKLHFLDIDKETRMKRVLKRNTEKGDTFEFEVTQENFDFMESWFESPSDEELGNDSIIVN